MASVHLNSSKRQAVIGEVKKLLHRHVAACSFDFPFPQDHLFYSSVIGKNLAGDLALIRKTNTQEFMNTADIMYIMLPDVLDKVAFGVKLDSYYVLPEKDATWRFSAKKSGFPITTTSHPDMAPALEEWAKKYMDAKNATNAAIGYIESLLDECRTAGQIRRACPDLINLLPQDLQIKLGDTVARRMPSAGKETLRKIPAAVSIAAAGVMLPDRPKHTWPITYVSW